jgi:hypothetical protein
MNQQEIKTKIQELETRINRAKEERNIENYTLKPFYLANEQYVFMLEEAQIELIKKLNQTLVNKNK